MINVAILEDDLFMRNRLMTIMQSWDYVRQVFAAESNAEFAEILSSNKIDVLLADIKLADGSGVQSIRLLHRGNVNAISLVISALTSNDVILEAIQSGAIGYLHKDDSTLQVVNAVRSAMRDEAPLSPGIAFRILRLIQDGKIESIPKKAKSAQLTAREIEILNLIAIGMSNLEISDKLGLAKSTVPVHARNIYRKLGTNRRAEAIHEAREKGILV